MAYSTQEAYKRMTGADLPKPWAERTEAERLRAREAFLASISSSGAEDEAAMDEFIANVQRNLEESRSLTEGREDVDAA